MLTRTIKTAAILLALGASAFAAIDDGFKTLFDGKSSAGWKLNTGGDLPKANLQEDGLNPHGSGGYIVVHEKPVGDFVLDFDYKISKGCNSGVFLKVGDLKDPVNTGLEIAIDDTTGTGMHDSGAFYDLVPTTRNAQKLSGQWNHMTITAKGPKIAIVLNEEKVSEIDLSKFTEGGKRPDGTKHKFGDVKIADFDRPGYFGFQDHGQDCWYKNVKVKNLD